MPDVTVYILGFGKVGRELVKLILREGQSRGLILAAVSDSRGTLIAEGPADKALLLRLAEEGRRLSEHPSYVAGLVAPESIEAIGPGIVFSAIPPSYTTGEPNMSIYRALLEEGINLVTADKTPLALDYEGFLGLARENGAMVGYRATVAAGTPVIDVARALRFRGVGKVEAVLNATTTYVLDLVASGMSLEEAVEKSIMDGFAEPDPRIDLDGWDAAAKLAIILGELGRPTSLREITRKPFPQRLPAGMLYRQVAQADLEQGVALVGLKPVEPGSPLARARGERNVAVFGLEGTNIVVEGPAGPAWRTARVMYADALEILEQMGG